MNEWIIWWTIFWFVNEWKPLQLRYLIVEDEEGEEALRLERLEAAVSHVPEEMQGHSTSSDFMLIYVVRESDKLKCRPLRAQK